MEGQDPPQGYQEADGDVWVHIEKDSGLCQGQPILSHSSEETSDWEKVQGPPCNEEGHEDQDWGQPHHHSQAAEEGPEKKYIFSNLSDY